MKGVINPSTSTCPAKRISLLPKSAKLKVPPAPTPTLTGRENWAKAVFTNKREKTPNIKNILFFIFYFSIKFITFKSRSEEHTSELQSRENLVCRLLLEKKKKR